MNTAGQPVLYAITTGAIVAGRVGRLVTLAQRDGWDVCVISSPDGRAFLDTDEIAALTGHPVRSVYKDPTAPDVLPPADAMIVAPATCNTLAKWAAGISDALHLGLLVEAVGKRQPVVAVPYSTRPQISFPAIQNAMTSLAEWGVSVLRDDAVNGFEPGADEAAAAAFPWERAWQAVLDHPWLRI